MSSTGLQAVGWHGLNSNASLSFCEDLNAYASWTKLNPAVHSVSLIIIS